MAEIPVGTRTAYTKGFLREDTSFQILLGESESLRPCQNKKAR
jgi:hypothetical protein